MVAPSGAPMVLGAPGGPQQGVPHNDDGPLGAPREDGEEGTPRALRGEEAPLGAFVACVESLAAAVGVVAGHT